MTLFPNIIRFSVYDAQWSSGHSSFVPVEGLIFCYSKPKIQAPQQLPHGNDVLREAWHGLNMHLYMECTRWVPEHVFKHVFHLFQIHSTSQKEAR